MNKFFTSESVTEGHPDKICDQIADAVLDNLLMQDSMTRCACEVIAESDSVHIMGEITSNSKVDYEKIAREVIEQIGYTKSEYGFDAESCNITCSIHNQSPDIALGVNKSFEAKIADNDDIGAGDQGMMFGYACNETDTLMPLPIVLAHSLTKRLTYVRKNNILNYLRPDGKAQVTIEYENDIPLRVDTVVVSAQHDEGIDLNVLKNDIINEVIYKAIPVRYLDKNTKIYINPTGRFVYGGPAADTGLTGRKIIADTYGGFASHGGGSFSGKDCTKVDRSAAYMARNIAKTIVASGAASRCEVQLSYAIGVAQPVSIYVDTKGTGLISDIKLCDFIKTAYDLRPKAIIEKLELRNPVYSQTSCYGHFGRSDTNFSWEVVDNNLVKLLKTLINKN